MLWKTWGRKLGGYFGKDCVEAAGMEWRAEKKIQITNPGLGPEWPDPRALQTSKSWTESSHRPCTNKKHKHSDSCLAVLTIIEYNQSGQPARKQGSKKATYKCLNSVIYPFAQNCPKTCSDPKIRKIQPVGVFESEAFPQNTENNSVENIGNPSS